MNRVPVLESYSFQPPIKDKDLTAPPGSPAKGDRYIVGASATGAWATHDDDIAWYDGSAWQFDTPSEGWFTWVEDENAFYNYITSWSIFSPGGAGAEGALYGKRLSGYYYTIPTIGYAPTTRSTGTNYLYAIPFVVPADQNFDRIAIYVVTASPASTHSRLGIYNSGADGKPGTLLLDAGEVLTDTTGLKEITINQTLTAGLYWLAIYAESYPTIYAISYNYVINILGYDGSQIGNQGNTYYEYLGTYGVLPDPFPAATLKRTNPFALLLRKS